MHAPGDSQGDASLHGWPAWPGVRYRAWLSSVQPTKLLLITAAQVRRLETTRSQLWKSSFFFQTFQSQPRAEGWVGYPDRGPTTRTCTQAEPLSLSPEPCPKRPLPSIAPHLKPRYFHEHHCFHSALHPPYCRPRDAE